MTCQANISALLRSLRFFTANPICAIREIRG